MRFLVLVLGVICLIASPIRTLGTPTGLNTIPTTDIAPFRSWIAQFQNGNTSLNTPALYSAPNLLYQNQFGWIPRIEAGADWIQPPDLDHRAVTFNIKGLLQNEDEIRPNAAVGIWNIARHQVPGYYLTLSKTLNYDQEQRERFRAHHRRNRKLLGRRIHAGVTFDGRRTFQPFLGTDLQLNDTTVFQADWINGPGNGVTFGGAYVFPDQRTVVNPALIYSNNTKRIDGFFVNISHQFNI